MWWRSEKILAVARLCLQIKKPRPDPERGLKPSSQLT